MYKLGLLIYISSGLKTYLRFPTQLYPVSDWLVYQADVVHAKTVCLGSCANVMSIIMLHLPFYIFWCEPHGKFNLTHDLGIVEEWSHSFVHKTLSCSENVHEMTIILQKTVLE